mgnify:FL=1
MYSCKFLETLELNKDGIVSDLKKILNRHSDLNFVADEEKYSCCLNIDEDKVSCFFKIIKMINFRNKIIKINANLDIENKQIVLIKNSIESGWAY